LSEFDVVWQVGYCGLDSKHSANNDSLDIMTYCKGYVAWDYMSLFIQVHLLQTSQTPIGKQTQSCNNLEVTLASTNRRCHKAVPSIHRGNILAWSHLIRRPLIDEL